MNLKVTLTYILTEDDWDVSQLLQDCDSYNISIYKFYGNVNYFLT